MKTKAKMLGIGILWTANRMKTRFKSAHRSRFNGLIFNA